MTMTYSHANVQGQRSVGSADTVETNGRTDRQTDGGDRITYRFNAVGNSTQTPKHARLQKSVGEAPAATSET